VIVSDTLFHKFGMEFGCVQRDILFLSVWAFHGAKDSMDVFSTGRYEAWYFVRKE